MNLEARTNALVPLPVFASGPGNNGTSRVGLRRFGTIEADLAVDFSVPNRAALVSRLLETCTVDPERALPNEFFRELSIGKRIECLLILAAGRIDASLDLVFKCLGCGEDLVLELSVNELSELQREADLVETVGIRDNERWIEFRKPRGRDQEVWSNMVLCDEQHATATMIDTLVVTPGLQNGIETALYIVIEAALDEADPLVDFSCSVNCGECGEVNEYLVDLTETAIGILNRSQQQLIYSVHRLASRYHWTEREIFAVPEWRRQEYLKHIGTRRK